MGFNRPGIEQRKCHFLRLACTDYARETGRIECYSSPMAKTSAGLLMYRLRRGPGSDLALDSTDDGFEVLLVHPGGPFWAKKDYGAWVVPKGEINPGEEPLAAAKREFEEETGVAAQGVFVPLGTVKHKGGKIVHAWAFEGDCDPTRLRSNTFSMEWPPRSGRRQEFPEIDRGEFFTLEAAHEKINSAEFDFVLRLRELLSHKKPVRGD
jgi:predicted NUDIX family NTP pyrophosphohydrolase